MDNYSRKPAYIYTYTCSPDERSLCELEMRSFFGFDTKLNLLKNERKIDPARSPFMKGRLDVLYEGESVADIVEQVKEIPMMDSTFKVKYLKINDLKPEEKIEYQGQREIEREIGWNIQGQADVRHPERLYGIVAFEGRWHFGKYVIPDPVWYHHVKKPREYSTALSTRVARAVSNIAVPHPEGKKAIDPCCGIGTVLVEALSMGIDMEGRDINPIAVDGSRENIAFFGLKGSVEAGPIAEVTKHYDAAIIDLPYNLATNATTEEQFSILKEARRISDKTVIVTVDTIDGMIREAGFEIADRCVAKKAGFIRQIIVGK